MGSKWIWIIVSVIFGIICGTIYAWLRRKDGKTMRRWTVWSAMYTLAGLIICRVLWIVFAG